MVFVWLVGLAFVALMMSGDGTRHHLLVVGLYLLGGLAALVLFVMFSLKAASSGKGSHAAIGAVGLSVAGGAAIVVLAILVVAIGVVLNL